jgi:hypothetical protein
MENRINKLDDSCIFQAQKQKIDKPRTESYFTLIGHEEFQDKDFNPRLTEETAITYAKSIYIPDNNSTRYYVKLDSRGKLYNPIGTYQDNQQHQFINKVCKDNIRYKDVSPKIFDMYLSFLKTKNESWLNNAEREMI